MRYFFHHFLQKKRFWAGLFLTQILVFYFFSRWKIAINFFQWIFEAKKTFFLSFFSIIPFSMGDVFYVVLGLWILWTLIKIFKKKYQHSFSLKLLRFLNIFYFIYQCFWGMTYFQTPIIQHLAPQEPHINELKALSIKYLKLAKNTRSQVKENPQGVFFIENIDSIKKEIITQQKSLPSFLRHKKFIEYQNIKPSIFSQTMNYTGILGYYNPFTTEAQYNALLPHSFLPFTLSHEFAHQIGYAREQEANFIAYLIGKNAQNPHLKYATEYTTLKHLLHSLSTTDEAFTKKILAQFSESMKRDLNAEKVFIQQHQSWLNDFFALTNDLFLKSNQQDGSITYSYFVNLLVRYERQYQKEP